MNNDDRVYPSSTKPPANGAVPAPPPGANNNNNAAAAAFPATKAQLYNASRPAYRPQPRHRSRRSCCCRCCLWTTFSIILLLFLLAIAGAVLWVIYRPHRPNFSVSTFQISQFNLTGSSNSQLITSTFNLTLIARNPNKKLVFFYDPISVSVSTDRGTHLGDGTFPAFTHSTKNTTTLKTTIGGGGGQSIDDASATGLKSDLKKNSLPLKVQLDTKVKVKMGSLNTKKVPIRVTCTGINAAVPTGKTPATPASTGKIKCKVDARIKIWKWTL
ncbi:NDR1/HIN1-like protein 6 [Impatiens glandulifera]|uniref:NDR1/HIN1-like protein 6 n=1 Tax=Impatiens glandulifera TaxID=253017 RepID=UPI001FB140E8|nr:NDR1/HIN1-like protein 6 [Impatiens glandulifera]